MTQSSTELLTQTTHDQDARPFETAALVTPGTMVAWGSNNSGQLGDGTTTDHPAPVSVPGLAGISAIAAGNGHVLALLSNGTVRAWGNNGNGQLGNGTTTDSSLPTTVNTQSLNGPVLAIAAGRLHSLALLAGAGIKGWGNNSDGQLGNGGTNSPRVFPVSVSTGAETAIMIEAGGSHSVALLVNGTVRTWGRNNNGQLGDGTTVDRSRPVQVLGLTGITTVAGGSGYSLALSTGKKGGRL
jgi:alpha-tubulin suppressor-like RCC1 family protein